MGKSGWSTYTRLNVAPRIWGRQLLDRRKKGMTNTIAMPIFQNAFPEYQALFAFDNALNRCCFTEDALVASNVSLNPSASGRQPHMREGFDHTRRLPLACFNDEYFAACGYRQIGYRFLLRNVFAINSEGLHVSENKATEIFVRGHLQSLEPRSPWTHN